MSIRGTGFEVNLSVVSNFLGSLQYQSFFVNQLYTTEIL